MNLFNPQKKSFYRYASIKRDGHFTRVQIRANGVRVFSRNNNEITDKVKYCQWFKDIRLGYDREFLGELWLPGGVSTDVPHAMKIKNPKLRFDVFSATHFADCESLEEVRNDAHSAGLEMIPFWDFQNKQFTQEVFTSFKDVEGFVYSDGNRMNQVKEKPMKSADLIVLGFIPGEGKYAGQIGSLRVGTIEGEELATCSGFTDELRKEMSLRPTDFIGMVAEIQYQKVASGGRLRHPVFLGFRFDKQPSECTVEQLK